MTTTEISSEQIEAMLSAEIPFDMTVDTMRSILTELRDRRAAGGSPEIAAAMMRVTAIVEGLYGYLDMGAHSPEELKVNWNRWVEEKQKLWELSQIYLHLSPDTGKSQDQEGTWSDGGKEWTPNHIADAGQMVITDEMVERAAKAIAENHWSIDGAFMKAVHVSETWEYHSDDARAALTAAVKGGLDAQA